MKAKTHKARQIKPQHGPAARRAREAALDAAAARSKAAKFGAPGPALAPIAPDLLDASALKAMRLETERAFALAEVRLGELSTVREALVLAERRLVTERRARRRAEATLADFVDAADAHAVESAAALARAHAAQATAEKALAAIDAERAAEAAKAQAREAARERILALRAPAEPAPAPAAPVMPVAAEAPAPAPPAPALAPVLAVSPPSIAEPALDRAAAIDRIATERRTAAKLEAVLAPAPPVALVVSLAPQPRRTLAIVPPPPPVPARHGALDPEGRHTRLLTMAPPRPSDRGGLIFGELLERAAKTEPATLDGGEEGRIANPARDDLQALACLWRTAERFYPNVAMRDGGTLPLDGERMRRAAMSAGGGSVAGQVAEG